MCFWSQNALEETKKALTPTRNRVYSRIYRQVMANGGSREKAREKAKAECDKQGL